MLILLTLILWRMQLLLQASQRQAAALAEFERMDLLTGLPNRPRWDEQLPWLAAGAQDAGGVLTIALLHIDDFARQRETKAGRIAELLLVSATIAWLGELSDDDVLARYGPDEFVLAIQRSSMADAQETLRSVVRATPEAMSISSGAAVLRPDEDAAAALGRAEGAMRASKTGIVPRQRLEQELTS